MAENPYAYPESEQQQTRPARRGVDVFSLIVGLVTLLVSAYVLSDGASWMPTFDFRWILAGGAVFVGVLLLGASFRKRRP
ncbi:hypothetical protein OG943_41140 [Amycolatopsis sp. NBC_00345]|uniref:hypothetical protein n=1 Tax=Amycolatopsis sp. NBC_00345 TaxID=2975955 RepID=UPI002E264EC2